jgi:hypothetical protein
MATVWTFGDSLTERFNPKYEWSRDYIEWKGYVPKVYGNFVSEMLNYDLQNLGKGGSDNYTIFETFCKEYQNIADDDIVIIGWSYFERFRLVNIANKWNSVLSNYQNPLNNFDCISEGTINEILINRTNYKYIEEVDNWIKFINLACINKKIFHWSFNKVETVLNAHIFNNMEKIAIETSGLINDAHLSERGQKQLADELLKAIEIGDSGVKKKKLI